MLDIVKQSLWNQMGASIDMLEDSIVLCPEEEWDTDLKFWYQAFHALFFLDYYLTMEPKDFIPPQPFTESEFEDRMPEKTYIKTELLNYLYFCREKGKNLIEHLTEQQLKSRWINLSGSMNYSVHEIILYNIRHLQHHVAQLNLHLRQTIKDAPEWLFQAK
ncbi:DinB family protein [Emticicia sp. C21]|uniref:DinB family protein n=1 Tax=Emticicia sp. C21 TaxID=2302915 RepID=UPI000E349300|nr:DinB family protein [Emticicia sp. C21]RFS17267.1 DinB family protein [Emticicia sp. C21]